MSEERLQRLRTVGVLSPWSDPDDVYRAHELFAEIDALNEELSAAKTLADIRAANRDELATKLSAARSELAAREEEVRALRALLRRYGLKEAEQAIAQSARTDSEPRDGKGGT